MLKINKILSKKIKLTLSLRVAKQRSNLSGFSLIELMVAVVILAMAIFGIFHAYSVGFMGMADARDRTVATNYTREAMENVKNMDFELIIITDESNPSVPEILNGKFNRLVTVAEVIIDGAEILELKKVTTEVNWLDRNGNLKKVVIDTLIYNYD